MPLAPQDQAYYDSMVSQTTLSELIAIGDLSMDQRDTIRKNVDIALVQVALSKAVANDPSGLVVRDALPTTDWGLTGGPSVTGEEWIVAGAGTAGTYANYINNKQLTTTQCGAFWSIGGAIAPSNVSVVKFLFGPGTAQTKMVVQIEKLLDRLEPEGYLSSPIIYVAQDNVTVQVLPIQAWAANTERLVLGSRIVDQFGNIISAHNFA